MKQVAPAVRDLARRLLAHEAGESQNREEMAHVAECACTKLRFHLIKVVGLEGFRALLTRALALAKSETPWLSAVQVQADGSLAGLGEAASRQDRDQATKGFGALLTQFLGLLVTFIGEALTLRLVREIWPEALLDDTLAILQEEAEG